MEKEIYTVYSIESDMTFIMEDVKINNEVVSTEVKGFYFDKEDQQATKDYYGSLKANFK